MIDFMKTTALAVTAALLLFLMIVVAVVTLALANRLDDQSTPLVVNLLGMIGLAIPTLLAAAFAERASRDIRNGTLVEKSRQGSAKALEEKGEEVARKGATRAIEEQEVMTRTGPVASAELVALTKILAALDDRPAPAPVEVQVTDARPSPGQSS